MTTRPDTSVCVLAIEATVELGAASGPGASPALVRVLTAALDGPVEPALTAVAAEHTGLPLAADFGYSAGAELDDRVAALLATIARTGNPSAVPPVLTLVAPVTLDEQCAAAAYAVAGGVALIVSDQPDAVERAVRVTVALRAHESVVEPVAP